HQSHTASLGMSFGAVVSIGVLVVAALVFHPHGIRIDKYDQAAVMLTSTFGRPGYYLFAASLAISCLGAALEVALTTAYSCAQGLGWNWGENKKPREAAPLHADVHGSADRLHAADAHRRRSAADYLV